MLSFISNYRPLTLFIKSLFFILTSLPITLILFRDKIHFTIRFNKNQILLFSFLGLLAISILWSENKNYGILKFYQLIIVFYPNVLAIKYYHKLFDKINFSRVSKYFLIILSVLAFITIFSPPVKFENYILKQSLISHVFLGRLYLIGIIINLYFILLVSKKYKHFYFLSFFVLILGLNQLALRSAILSTFIILLVIIIFFRYDKSFKTNALSMLLIFLLSFALTLVYSKNLKNRLPDSSELNNLIGFTFDSVNDITISSRINGIKEGIELFLDNPIFGNGLGSYNSSTELRKDLKYPHNMFIEIAAENGVTGLVYFIILLLVLIKHINKFNIKLKAILWIIFLYYFLLAQFSKDLSTNFQFFSILFLKNRKN